MRVSSSKAAQLANRPTTAHSGTMSARSTTRRTGLALAGAAALLLATACSDDGDPTPADVEPPTVTGAPEETGPDGGEPTDDAGPESEPGDGDVPAEYEGVLAAIDLAVAEHDGAPAFEVDDDDDRWEVHVAVGDDDIEVHVSADGTEVLSSDRESDLDSDDRAGLEAAGDYTLADAVRAAIAEYGGTNPIDDVSISEENGSYAWEVAFTDDVEVYLDIATGDVIRVEND